MALGSGYHQGYDVLAQELVNADFLPWFRDGDHARGIEDGTAAVIARIARPHLAGQVPVASRAGSLGMQAIVVVLAAFGAVWLFIRRRFGGFSAARRRCPVCDRRALKEVREVLRRPSRAEEGEGHTATRCRSCGWHEERTYTILRRSISSSSRGGGGGSFGGGSSSGGGAGGRW